MSNETQSLFLCTKGEKMEEEDREMEEKDGEGRGGNKMEKRKELYRDPWVAVKLLVEKVLTC